MKYPPIFSCLAEFGSDFHVPKPGVHVGKIYLEDDINYSAEGPDWIEIKISLLQRPHLNQKLEKCNTITGQVYRILNKMSQQKLSPISAYLVKQIIEIIYQVIDIKRRAVFLPNTDLLKSDNSFSVSVYKILNMNTINNNLLDIRNRINKDLYGIILYSF